MNKWYGIGRVAKDIELRSVKTADGEISVARFTVATDRPGKDKGADFISCVAWRKTAEFIAKYFQKGSRIALAGRITTGSYEKDGKKIYTTEVTVDEAEFCESKREIQTQPSAAPEMMDIPEGIESDLPFL